VDLTTKLLQQFVGGQMEIQNQGEGYLYRGEVKTIAVENNELRATFAWMAKGEGFPALKRWVKDEKTDYTASLVIYSASNVGPSGGDVGGGDRFVLNSLIIGDLVTLFPPDGSKLDAAKVEGFEPVNSQ